MLSNAAPAIGRRLRLLLCLTGLAGIVRGQEPPYAETQERVLRTVTEFARGYLERLPDFTCIRTTQHFLAVSATKEWQPEVRVAYELSYYGSAEHYRLIAVDDLYLERLLHGHR